jgi:predicted metal-binding membrane protein
MGLRLLLSRHLDDVRRADLRRRRAATELADNSMGVMDNAARIGGGVLILAGLYELSPLKDICLSK